jgi:hypothetical protein
MSEQAGDYDGGELVIDAAPLSLGKKDRMDFC